MCQSKPVLFILIVYLLADCRAFAIQNNAHHTRNSCHRASISREQDMNVYSPNMLRVSLHRRSQSCYRGNSRILVNAANPFQGVVQVSSEQNTAPWLLHSIKNSCVVKSFGLIFFSELGDKTFWMSALLAAKYGKIVTFIGVMSAVALMGCLAATMGWLFRYGPTIRYRNIPIEDFVSFIAFSFFGWNSIWEAIKAKEFKVSETEARHDLSIFDSEYDRRGVGTFAMKGIIFWKIFCLILSAELGDRSFLSILALATTSHPLYVTTGAFLAHGATTILAILGGYLISNYFGEATISWLSGLLFLSNAVAVLWNIITKLK